MPDRNPDIAVIILAAGASARMGKPKQLLKYNHTTLLGHAVELARAVSSQIVVVTGAIHEEISAAITADISQGITWSMPKDERKGPTNDIRTVHNPEWQTGMASSLRTGLTALESYPDIAGAMILLCDQPLITAEHLQALYQAFINHKSEKIIASTYQNLPGVPAIFPKSGFNQLLNLSGDEGARKLLRNGRESIVSLPFNGGSLDIDTPEDYLKAINMS